MNCKMACHKCQCITRVGGAELVDRVRDNDPDVLCAQIDSDCVRLDNIEFMRLNTTLVHLDIFDCRVSDLSPLEFNTTLTCLDAGFNTINGLSPLRFNTTLTALEVHSNNINDASPLRFNTTLTNLSIGENGLVDTSAFDNNTTLTDLYISWNAMPNADCDSVLDNVSRNKHNCRVRALKLRHIAISVLRLDGRLKEMEEMRRLDPSILSLPEDYHTPY